LDVNIFEWAAAPTAEFAAAEGARVEQSDVGTCAATQSSSQSEKSLWARSYKNEPIPAGLRARLVGKKYEFHDSSDEDEEIMAVAEEEEEEPTEKNERKRTRLPTLKVVSDWGEFSDSCHSAINSERKLRPHSHRCHSVASLRLPQVLEEKREDDEWRRRGLPRFAAFKDKNEFGERRKRRSSSDYTEAVSQEEGGYLPGALSKVLLPEAEQILEEAEESRPVKLAKERGRMEFERLIVDEVAGLEKKKEALPEIEGAIEEEKLELEIDTGKLSHSLCKFQSESNYLTMIRDEHLCPR
jgi:hypothetical protein